MMTCKKLLRTRPIHRILIGIAILAISGCGDDRYKGVSSSQVNIQSASTGMTSEQVGGVVPVREETDDLKRFRAKKNPNDDPDDIRILKNDLYYKFEWARRVLGSHVVPLDLAKLVEDVKTRSSKLPSDRISFLIKDIVGLLQDGVDADKLDQAERLSPTEFPRGSSDSSTGEGKKEKPKFGSHTTLSISTRLGEKDRLIRLKDSASRRHQSFSVIKWQKFDEAGIRTQELAHSLGIQTDAVNATDIPTPSSASP